jgi:hypothetical protein
MPPREQPSWTPWAYVGVGVFGLVIVGLAASAGQFGIIDVIILGGSAAAIVVGIRKLRGL